MFERIDYEHTGQLSLEQLVEGARRDAEFQSRLRVMDIDEHDLVQLFDMIDTDQSGFIESAEFVRPLSRWVHDSRTAPRDSEALSHKWGAPRVHQVQPGEGLAEAR